MMEIETCKVSKTEDDIEQHFIKIFIKGTHQTTFSVSYDKQMNELWLNYVIQGKLRNVRSVF